MIPLVIPNLQTRHAAAGLVEFDSKIRQQVYGWPNSSE